MNSHVKLFIENALPPCERINQKGKRYNLILPDLCWKHLAFFHELYLWQWQGYKNQICVLPSQWEAIWWKIMSVNPLVEAINQAAHRLSAKNLSLHSQKKLILSAIRVFYKKREWYIYEANLFRKIFLPWIIYLNQNHWEFNVHRVSECSQSQWMFTESLSGNDLISLMFMHISMIKHVFPGFIILARTVSIYVHNVPGGIKNISGSWSKLLCINALKSG